jgi:flagellar motor switch protein FliM
MEILSQEDIDRILSAINGGDGEPENFKPAKDIRKIRIYDFMRPDKFSRKHLRTMSMLHETFARNATLALTSKFKTSCHIHVASVDQLDYQEFTRFIQVPAAIAVIDLNGPMKSQAIIEISQAVSCALASGSFGWSKGYIKQQHELTRLEWVAVTDAINQMLESMKEGWKRIADLDPKINRTDTTPQFLNVCPPADMTVLITLEAKIGDSEGMINIDYPYTCLEGIMDKLSETYWQNLSTAPPKKYKLNSREDIPVELTAEVLRRNYSIGDILNWQEEELLLPLQPRVPDTCYLRTKDRRIWYCDILEDKNWFPKKIKLNKLADFFAGSEGKMEIMNGANPAVAEALAEAGITISVELGKTSKPVRDILSLKEGSIVELDKLAGEPVDIKANGVLIAKGEVVVIDENFGVRVTEIVRTPGSQVNGSK